MPENDDNRPYDDEAGLGETPNDRLIRQREAEEAERRQRGSDHSLREDWKPGMLDRTANPSGALHW